MVQTFIFVLRRFSKFRCTFQYSFHFGYITLSVKNDNIITFIDHLPFITESFIFIKSPKEVCSSLEKFLSLILSACLYDVNAQSLTLLCIQHLSLPGISKTSISLYTGLKNNK